MLGILSRRLASTAVKPPLQFKPVLNRWKPTSEDQTILKSIAQEFSERILKRDQGDKLAASLAYGLTKDDIEAAVGNSAKAVANVLSLQYANQQQLNQFNKHQAIELFSRGPNDTGSPEAQAAVLTVRIGYLMKHAEKHRHDYSAKRLIVQQIHERKRHLKYLRRLSLSRYFEMLDKLGLPHDYLESFDNPYLYRYRAKAKAKAK